nr:unnamed protein product [Callosobruchus analis]
MNDISVDVAGEMEPPLNITEKSKFPSFMRIPTHIPDPKEFISSQRQNVRSWLVFIQTSNFKAPPSIPRLGKRIMRNIEYFQANYLFVFLGLVVYCLITSPLILIVIAGSFYAGYRLNKRHMENKKIFLFKQELTLAHQYGLVMACSLPVYYLVGAHSAMFWVIGASIVIITLHAAFYNIDALVKSDDAYPLLEEV